MGKACVRFKKVDDLALEVIGEAIRQVTARKYIDICERAVSGRQKAPAKKVAAVRKAAKTPKSTKKSAPKRSPRMAKR